MRCRFPSLACTVLFGLLNCEASAANLGAIVALARDNDATYAAARAAADAGREKSAQGRAGLLPAVKLSGSESSVHEYNSAYEGARNHGLGNWSLSLVQPLLRKASVETFRQGELQAQLAEQQLMIAEQDLLLRTARGYFDVLQAQDALASVRAQKDAFAQQLAQARKSYEVGLAPVTDVNEAQTRYDLTLAQEIATRNDLEVKRRALEKSIRHELPPLAALDTAASIDILPPEQQRALAERAPAEALQVRAGNIAEEIARREVARQDAGHWPSVDLVASTGENRNMSFGALGGINNRLTSVGVEVNVPLYQGGDISSHVREAAANLARAASDLESARLQATFDARQALLGVQSGSALHQALRQALASNETQVRSTQRGFEVGVRTRVDVLNAEQQLYATRRDLSAARYQTLVSGLQLEAAAGVLTEQDLRALDALLKE